MFTTSPIRIHTICIRLSVVAMMLCAAGCFRHRVEPLQSPTVSQPFTPSAPQNEIAELPATELSPIQHFLVADSNGGTPLGTSENATLRSLTLEDARQMAAQQSPVANAIEKEMRQLRCRPELSECLGRIMMHQAQHERSVSAGQAAEAYLALAGIYLQHDILIQSTDELESVAKIIAKVKASGVPFEFDDRTLHRKQNDLEEQAVELHAGQQRLTRGLELLLDARKYPDPIWTDWSIESHPEWSLDEELEKAWQNRHDLKALELLVQCCGADLMETIQASARSLHPLLGLALSKRRPLQPRFRFRQQQEQEACCQADQIRDLITTRRKLIEEEITGLVLSIQKRQRLIELKSETIASLQASIRDADKAAAIKPVDLETRMSNQARILELRSLIVTEAIQLEIERARLKAAQGLVN